MLFSELFSLQVMLALIFVSLSVMLSEHKQYFSKWLEVECYCFWKLAEQNLGLIWHFKPCIEFLNLGLIRALQVRSFVSKVDCILMM